MRILALLAVAAALLPGCVAPGVAPSEGVAVLPDVSGVAFEKIHTPEEIAAIVEGYAAFPAIAVDAIGESGGGRPLHRVVVGEGPFVLWAVGRHHGNEPTGAEAILLALRILADPDAELADDAPVIVRDLLLHRETILSRVTFVTIPVVNPDGAAAFTRGNDRTPDPNRDYVGFHTVESQLVRDAFWEARPDLCLDLHNEGESDRFDWDSFVPVGVPEPEVQSALEAQAWRTVHEVDAAGGFGGGPNENYRAGLSPPQPLPPVDLPFVNPTAYHPGTHDMFCSERGAPGWTPEGAIPPETEGGGNGGTHAAYAWSTRLHLVTLASALLEAAGAYDGLSAPVVAKTTATLDGPAALATVVPLDVPAGGSGILQVVWRPPGDVALAPLPVGVEFVTPRGDVLSPGIPSPGTYTASLFLRDAPAGRYEARVQGPPGTTLEFRARLDPADGAPVRVERTERGLRIESLAAHSLAVRLADVADPTAGAFAPQPSTRAVAEGTVAPRLLAAWDLTLAPGEVVDIAYPAVAGAGPFRWTATDGRGIAAGVETARSTDEP